MKKLFDSGKDDYIVVQSAGNASRDAALNSLFASICTSAAFQEKTGCTAWELQKMIDRSVVVASLDRPGNDEGTGKLSGFSNFGSRVDLAAPGKEIFSTAPVDITNGIGTLVKSGTSMAAAYASGTAGIIWSADPALASTQVKEILCANTGKTVEGISILDAELAARIALGETSEIDFYATGDVNGDNAVNAKDVTRLRRYIAGGWPDDSEISSDDAGDCNGDGVVDAKDVTRLRRFLAGGWDNDGTLTRGG
jgi:subtilisin family serine protease